MTIVWKTGRFEIRIDSGDLAGITNAVLLSVQVLDDYGEAEATMREKKCHWDYLP